MWLSLGLAASLATAPAGKGALRMEADGRVVHRVTASRLPAPGEGVVLLFAPGATPWEALARLEALGGEVVSLTLDPLGARIQATLPAASRAGIERLPGLRSVTRWAVPVPLNDDSIWVGQSGDAASKATPVFDRGITGSGETVAVYDTGLDPDMCFFVLAPGQWSPAQALLPPDTGTLHTGEKTWAYYVEPGATAYDYGFGHGTAVSGCVLGDDFLTPSSPSSPGHDPNDGMAPNARLILLDGGANATLSGIVGDLTPIFQQSRDAGARIQNHSWGSPGLNLYAPDAADIDRFMWRHEDMLFVNGNGNSGGAPDDGSVIDPAVCKNALGVGAVTNGAAGARDLTWFTSRGPTWDGRIKPDVVAPGEGIRTAAGDGTAGSDNCGGLATAGTSFSAPTVAGWSALLRQYFREGWLPTGQRQAGDETSPSAALLKSALIVSAMPIEGVDPKTSQPVDPPPSFNQGWGRPRLDDAMYFAGDARATTAADLWNAQGLRRGQVAAWSVDVPGPGQPLDVVVAWTDPPADPGAALALINDLDLAVIDPLGTRYLGNVWSGGESIAGGAPDTKNPVEAVRIAAPAAGRYTVEVRADRPLGRPGLDGSERQGFALVMTHAACAGRPIAPAGPTVVERAPGLELSWPAVAGASGYLVYRAEGAAAVSEHRLLTAAPVAASPYLDQDVQCGQAYSYLLRAWNGCSPGAAGPLGSGTRTLGGCTLAPSFAGLADARPAGPCGQVALSWAPAVSRCSCSTGLVYNVWASATGPVDPASTPPTASCLVGTGTTLDLGAGAGLTWFLVRAEDRVAGGGGPCGGVQDGNLAALWSAPVSPTRRVSRQDRFEAGRLAWSRATLAGSGAWDIVDEPLATSPGKALRALDHPFLSDSTATLVPAIVPTSETFAGFQHSFALEGRYDGGVIEVSTDGGASWVDAGARLVRGRYTDVLMTGPSNRILRPGFTSGTLPPMDESLVWLGDLAGQSVRLRLRNLTDASGRAERWAIDDFQVFDRDCPVPGSLVAAFTATAPACAGDAVAFDARGTYGAGSQPYSYTWDFGDGTPAAAGPEQTTHVYATPGSYIATLTARDASFLFSDSLGQPVEVVGETAAGDLGNLLRAVRRGGDVVASWSEPPGDWMGAELLGAALRDLGDLAPLVRVPWDEPRSATLYGAVAAGPALRLLRVRLLSTCRGTPGPA